MSWLGCKSVLCCLGCIWWGVWGCGVYYSVGGWLLVILLSGVVGGLDFFVFLCCGWFV